MKRIVLLVLILIAFANQTLGQVRKEKEVTFIEMDIGIGSAYPLSNPIYFKYAQRDNRLVVKPSLYNEFELRVNLAGRPHSLGVQYATADFHKVMGDVCEHISLENVTAFYDYNFRQGTWFNPFIGMGIGYSNVAHFLADMNSDIRNPWWQPLNERLYGAVCFTPRIGIEFFSHLRITFAMTYIDKYASFYGFTIGGVFGGGKKK